MPLGEGRATSYVRGMTMDGFASENVLVSVGTVGSLEVMMGEAVFDV